MYTLHIAAHRLSVEGHGTVDPGVDFGGPTTSKVTPEAGWDLDCELKFAAGQAVFHLRGISDWRMFDEVRRSSEPVQIGPAPRRPVTVERRECDVVHIGVDAEAEGQHQEGCAKYGEPEPHRIAPQLEPFADHVG